MAKPRTRRGGSSNSPVGASNSSSGSSNSRARASESARGVSDRLRDASDDHGGAADRDSRSGDGEEARVFRAAVRDVTPLAVDLQHRAAPARPPVRVRARARPRAPIVESASLGELVGSDDAPGVAAPGAADPLSFRRPGVRDQTLRHLRRGRYPVEDEVDLHGLNQAAARDLLADFIAASTHAGLRCVRVVHGKGYRSGARGPVLKIAVNTWLRRHADVLAFASARAIDGGTGAVYVLLR
jgi:DNA-nicking Smr family endonuclease